MRRFGGLCAVLLTTALLSVPPCGARIAHAEDCGLRPVADLPMIGDDLDGPVVSILIDGRPRNVLVDTGAFESLLDPSVAAGLRIHNSGIQGRLGLGAIPLAKMVLAPSVQIGSRRFDDVDFFRAPAGYLEPDGTLGTNWLSDMDVEIDPVERKVRFFTTARCGSDVVHWPHRDLAVVDTRFDGVGHVLTIPIMLDGQEIRALVDTGTPDTVISLREAKRLFGLTRDSPGILPGDPMIGRGGKGEPTWRYQFRSLEMGGIAFDHPWLTIAAMDGSGPQLILGMHQLGVLHLYVAYGQRKIYATTANGDLAARRAEAGGRIPPGDEHPSPLDRANADDYIRTAEALIDRRDKDEAAADLDKALALDPESAEAHVLRGALYADRGDRTRAMQAVDRAIRLAPGFGVAYMERGQLYAQAGNYDRALADADQAVRLLPRSAFALNGRCWFGAIMGRLEGALADCDAALELMPKAAEILDSRALVHLKAGRLDQAIEDYDSALAIDPKMMSSLYGRGLAKRQKGDRSGGDADIAAAEQAEPTIAQSFGK